MTYSRKYSTETVFIIIIIITVYTTVSAVVDFCFLGFT